MPTARNRLSAAFWEARTRSTPPAQAERRETTRIRFIAWQATVSPQSGPSVQAKVVAISETGARLILPCDIAKDARLDLLLTEPASGETLRAPARVLWVTPPLPDGDTWVAGTEFVDLAEPQRKRIARWWMEHTARERSRAGPAS